MKKSLNIFCWFLSGLTAGVALSGSTSPTAPPSTSAPPIRADSAAVSAPAQNPTGALKQNAPIWQCTTNGVRTFSNNPCGNQSFRVALHPVNTMTPPPVARHVTSNASEPRDSKEYTEQNLYPDQDASSQGSGGNGYPFDQGYIYAPLFRPNHHRHPEHHHDSFGGPHRSAAPPNNSAPTPPRTASVSRKN